VAMYQGHNSMVGEVNELIHDTREDKGESEIAFSKWGNYARSFSSWLHNLVVSIRLAFCPCGVQGKLESIHCNFVLLSFYTDIEILGFC